MKGNLLSGSNIWKHLFIFFHFCDVAIMWDHPQEELANLAIGKERKVHKIKESCYIIWWFACPYSLNMIISDFFLSLKFGDFGAFFCSKNSLDFFLMQSGKKISKNLFKKNCFRV
jgi:hypothetical protein